MAVATLEGVFNFEHHESAKMERNNYGKRRVFVQTETGCVVGLELDRSDNANTIKRRLQLALNVPTEETSLICGDVVLKNDLSTVRNDAPLLLTRNGLQRSSSTPCLSPSAQDIQQRDQDDLIEIIGCSTHASKTRKLIKDVTQAIQCGVDPIPISGGLGGTYYFRNIDGENVAIVKPTDEEPLAPNNPKGFVGKALGLPGLRRSVRVGETGLREVAAYLLDYDGFANVPVTALVKVTHPVFNVSDDVVSGKKQLLKRQASKIASFQQYIPHDFDASDHGTSSFPVSSVHRIGILDIRILNTDRHAGNLLVRKLHGCGRFDKVELIPIDHGLSLPEDLEDPYLEWIHWPQASIPFSLDEMEYINNLDPFRDAEMLRMELPVIREACLRVLILCTIFLKEAAAFGLCLAEIGEMISREFQGHEEEPSRLEMICMEARRNLVELAEEIDPLPCGKGDSDDFQFDLDSEDLNGDILKNTKETKGIWDPKTDGLKGGNGCKVLFRLEESDEDESNQECTAAIRVQAKEDIFSSSASKLWNTCKIKTMNSGKKSWKHRDGNALSGGSCSGGVLFGNRSLDEQATPSSNCVNLRDMNEDEWIGFLNQFHKHLYPAFLKYRATRNYVGFRQRLGTSCKF